MMYKRNRYQVKLDGLMVVAKRSGVRLDERYCLLDVVLLYEARSRKVRAAAYSLCLYLTAVALSIAGRVYVLWG